MHVFLIYSVFDLVDLVTLFHLEVSTGMYLTSSSLG